MAKAIRVHSVGSSNGVPTIQWMAYKTGEAIVIGSVLVYSSGELAVAGADPTEIVGVALQAAGTSPGYDAANSPTVITGRSQKISVVRPDNVTVFQATLTNNSSATATPAQADVGVQYGLTAYNGIVTVDKNKTGASARVEVVGFDEDQDVVFFKFLASHLSSN